jgi:hypothetical protein
VVLSESERDRIAAAAHRELCEQKIKKLFIPQTHPPPQCNAIFVLMLIPQCHPIAKHTHLCMKERERESVCVTLFSSYTVGKCRFFFLKQINNNSHNELFFFFFLEAKEKLTNACSQERLDLL